MFTLQSVQRYVDLIESKDEYTKGHSHHVWVVAGAIYDCLPLELKSRIDKDKLLCAALLHDLGKVNVPMDILNKDGKLTDDEWHLMKKHPEYGVNMLEGTPYTELSDYIKYHHERVDGSGYYGKTDIPIEARIIAVADMFSALRTYRIYRPAFNITQSVSIMRGAAPKQLDEDILNAFLSLDIDVLEKLECNCDICAKRKKEIGR